MNKKTIISTASRLFAALSLLLFLSGASIEAQVTIGKLADPHNAAILDLSQVESQNLGLLLPHVKLTGLTPFQLLQPDPQKEIDATGMVVYNEAHVNDDVYPGIYVWDGEKWGRIDDGTVPPMLPLPIMKSGDACGNGVLFSIPDTYRDWNSATKFVWSLTVSPPDDYTLAPVISGSKDSHFFVPYDGTERTYEVSVYAEGSKQRSVATIGLQSGQLNASNFSIDGADCYDIKKTDYVYSEETIYETRYGVWEKRKHLQAKYDYSYSVTGIGNNPTYVWSVSDQGGTLLNPPNGATGSSINIQFRPEVLNDTWLINHPSNEYIVVLTCLVTDGSCAYVVSKEIKVGDRDCCTGLRDIEGIIYTAVRFGSAGCWMTENLAVVKNQKRGIELTAKNSASNPDYYNPYYTFPSTVIGTHVEVASDKISLEDAQNSNYYGGNEGKPGLLYNWAAAVGAVDGTDTNTSGGARNTTAYPKSNATTTSAGDASRVTSKDEDICPVGWYLPSDKEWSLLEREISDNYNQYSTASSASTWTEDSGGFRGSHGSMMRNPKNIGSTQSPAGVSNPKESGFSGLLVGYAGDGDWYTYGATAYYWNSSSSTDRNGWYRGLGYDKPGVHRSQAGKYYLRSVRCKKLD